MDPVRRRNARGARTTGVRRMAALTAALLLVCLGLLATASGSVPVASAAEPTQSPFVEGRHVYDYAHRMSPRAVSIAETLASRIEAEGGGRTVIYTAEMMDLPDAAKLAADWNVDGLLLTAWDDFGDATIGATLKARLPAGTAEFASSTSSVLTNFESWATACLARAEGLISGRHVFDGAAVLDADAIAHAEGAADRLSAKIGIPVYVDIAMAADADPESTAFWNGDLHSGLGTSLVIALSVGDGKIGGRVEAATAYDDSYMTVGSWSGSTMWNKTVASGDVQAELLRAVDDVWTPPDPIAAVNTVADVVRRFAADETNQRSSIAGLVLALLALAGFAVDRRRRRRDGGYGDDESVLLPAPPSDMTPALAALVSSPLDTTRAVTTALLDLAAHGSIAFYRAATPYGPSGGIKVIAAAGKGGHAVGAHAPAIDRPLGPAETSLLEGLRGTGSGGRGIAGADFAGLRPLFEQTGERLERIAAERGWLRLQARSASRVWIGAGFVLLAAAAVAAYRLQPVAAVSLAVAGLIILPRATRMPLPIRTRDGQMTSAMVDAYRRTLKKALAGQPGAMPPWLANAEEAALWGYAWGLEGEVQSFVAGNVSAALDGTDAAGLEATSAESARLRHLAIVLGGVTARGGARPVGMDTDAIAGTLGSIGVSMESGRGTPPSGAGESS